MLEEYDSLAFIDAAAVRERVPVFAEGYLYGAAHERRGGDLDVDALLQGYLRLFRRLGGELKNDHRVDGLRFENGTWRVTAGAAEFRAPVVVNAAGGWVEQVAELAGLGSLGIRPMRRTALTVDAPDGISISDWPEMVDVDEEFYFKPEAGLIMISPADETPTRPCDAQPEDLDVATGVYRFEQATGLDVRQVRSSWAGLRTFAPDRLFVTGFDPRAEGFFWLAGQGGYGIQSAAAMAQMTRYLVQDIEPDEAFAAVSRYVEELSPARLLYA
jgi:D-arginine dehydrogenase